MSLRRMCWNFKTKNPIYRKKYFHSISTNLASDCKNGAAVGFDKSSFGFTKIACIFKFFHYTFMEGNSIWAIY